ncbi:MAG: tetratricopeptide repeat protein [Myxococcales bacterium]|nr:tetratricopeptide repeat protein [Myxococcales bacterium]
MRIVIVWFVGITSIASAQDASLDAEARALFEAGRTAFEAGRYEDALGHFQAALRRTDRPGLLHNIALAADRAGHREEAIASYEKFLETVPDTLDRPTIEGRLEELRRARRWSDPPSPFAEPRRAPRRLHPSRRLRASSHPRRSPRPRPSRRLRWPRPRSASHPPRGPTRGVRRWFQGCSLRRVGARSSSRGR